MSLDYSLDILKQNMMMAAVVLLFLLLIFIVWYRLIYKKLFAGKRHANKKHIFNIFMLIGYIIVVLGITLFNRVAFYQHAVNLDIFGPYIEAWYNVSLRDWQNIYLNILMFVPFGFLLPLVLKRRGNVMIMLIIALLFTFTIEAIQYVTKFGVFDLNDMLNNVMGALIGYGLIHTIIKPNLKEKFIYLMPLIIVVLISSVLFTYYHAKPYGNIAVISGKNIDIRDAHITSAIQLDDETPSVAIYKAPRKTKGEADLFAKTFYEGLNVDFALVEIITYQNDISYRYNAVESYHLTINLIDGTFRFTDFSIFNDHASMIEADETSLLELLKRFNIEVPAQATFLKQENKQMTWKTNNVSLNNKLINGTLTVDYYNDNTIKNIDNRIVEYDYVTDEPIMSVKSAFLHIEQGKFQYYKRDNSIKYIHIEQVELSYVLDSKGFYQPVYKFYSLIDDEAYSIMIPALASQ